MTTPPHTPDLRERLTAALAGELRHYDLDARLAENFSAAVDQAVDAALAAIGEQWRPIETFPDELVGEPALVLNEGGIEIAKCSTATRLSGQFLEWYLCSGDGTYRTRPLPDDASIEIEIWPTHWQPLPPPPSATAR